jgi:hypothetical protein
LQISEAHLTAKKQNLAGNSADASQLQAIEIMVCQ